ncbi:hypothetical protein RSOLAG1IB_08279 [Rhizoctonia solani AG-1 IB]|uniref:Uncharacterized protein n=1 Tax=Thanatephorus cucumeris (strain AG1-IB / isolate 7/3/14) TaxID=1108050 RepID=A0A0B7FG87_THACB|nr:hypothetical protein RSOLAG1IB_08279 [Rhizoctonia solani AG-1 IB]
MFRSSRFSLMFRISFVRSRTQSSLSSGSSPILAYRPGGLQSGSLYSKFEPDRGIRLASTSAQKNSTKPEKKAKPSGGKGSARPRKKRSEAELRTHLEAFFAKSKYSGFKYNPAKPYMEEFYRMTNQFGWTSKGTKEQQKAFDDAREGINEASVLQFNAIYGEDEKDLKSWRNLCGVLRIASIPKSPHKCREIVKSSYINICDLVDSPVLNTKVIHFNSEEELSAYTKRTGKFFPLEDAHAGGLLRFLLRKIRHPPEGKSPYPRPVLQK